MSSTLKNRNYLKLLDLTPKEVKYLLDLSKELKIAKLTGIEKQQLGGKNIVLLFEKASTRIRCAFEIAAFEQGAKITYISPEESQIRIKESLKDTARMLGRMYDGIGYCGFEQENLEIIAKFSGIPVWNGLSNDYHPTQVLADLLTMQEHCDRPLRKISFCYLGDARYNMGISLMIAAAKMGMDIRIAAPSKYQPNSEMFDLCLSIAKDTHAKITITDSVAEAVKNVDFIYTNDWISTDQTNSNWEERFRLLKPYQVTMDIIEQAKNPKVRFMHCLPAFHNLETKIGEEIFQRFGMEAMEVTDEVFESNFSIVWDQAENRIHTLKAIMIASLVS